ncbi:MAG TPA: hypothetical protein GXX49_02615 [Clostridiaceae bacterium]|nr:hypothetical protein [Clostridiaceae bacterium]
MFKGLQKNKSKYIYIVTVMVFITVLFSFQQEGKAIELRYDPRDNCLKYEADVTAGSPTGTRYKTIGFKVRIQGASGTAWETNIKMEQKSETPIGNNQVHVEFSIPLSGSDDNTIFDRFLQDYGNQEDILMFFKDGGTVKVIPLITIIENGVQLGYITENGELSDSADIYEDYPSIARARYWSQESLNDLYYLYSDGVTTVYFPPQPPDKLGFPDPKAIISSGDTIIESSITFKEEDFKILSGEHSDFPDYANKRYFEWYYRKEGTSSWSIHPSSGLMAVSPDWSLLQPGNMT